MFIRGKFVASDAEITAALTACKYGKKITDFVLNDFRDWCWLNFVKMQSESDVYVAVFKCIESGYIGA